MTATVTQHSQQQQTGLSEKEWTKIFPKQVTENYTNSLIFMKQLTTVAVSTITYLKNAFSEDSYYNESFGGLKLKLLKNKCCDELAQFVSTAMHQAFEAFDKKYVNQLALCFYEGDCKPENLLEYHVFEYSYNADGGVLSINSKNRSSRHAIKCSMEQVRSRTAMLIRSLTLFVFQNCQQELPLNYDISLRLYYNDAAPEGYQAPGFLGTSGEDHLESSAGAVCLGWVETPHHKLVARTFVRDAGSGTGSDHAEPSDNVPEMTQADNDDFQGSRGAAPEPSPEPDTTPRLRCPCRKQDAHGQTLVTCQYCHMQQHATCFGLMAPVPGHCCDVCADEDSSRRPSDPKLFSLKGRKRESLCILRRTLALCRRARRVAGAALRARLALSHASAGNMLRLLCSYNILPDTDGDDLSVLRKINPIALELVFKLYFQGVEPDNMAERLAAESVPPPDPVGDMLGPMEKFSLQNSSHLGTVVENSPDAHPVIDDPTLQQYREAILTNQDISEELPLSGSHNPVKDVESIGKKKQKRKAEGEDDWLPKLPKLRSGAMTKKRTA